MNKKMICFHLLNDYSGSPKVLSQVINGFVKSGINVDMYCAENGQKGFLSNLNGVNEHHFYYKWSPVKLVTLIRLFYSQLILFLRLFTYWNQDVVFYVNTVLPFGALLAGKFMGKRVICHLHETSIQPKILKWYLFKIVEITTSDVIYVSEFLKKQEPIRRSKHHVVYNSLPQEFMLISDQFYAEKKKNTVLMICSLKEYKGVFEFVKLAGSLPDIKFELVVNAAFEALSDFFKDTTIPKNLKIFPVQRNVHAFYSRAFMVLNLSHPDKWVETFGLTALEAMCYGVPVIVPPVGGIAEVVQHGVNGFRIDVREFITIKSTIKRLWSSSDEYQRFSVNAKKRILDFMPDLMQTRIQNIIFGV